MLETKLAVVRVSEACDVKFDIISLLIIEAIDYKL